jgi:molecular chaperone IbpA
MRHFDFSPFTRQTIGFDKLFSLIENAQDVSYPPYNIERQSENDYRITLAVAGFKTEEITIEGEGNTLKVSGDKAEDTAEYLHKGIAGRAFERTFQLADYVEVVEANLEHGLLYITLKRNLPDAEKPRRIAINSNVKALEAVA